MEFHIVLLNVIYFYILYSEVLYNYKYSNNISEEKAILISEPWFSQIKNGKKKLEVRGNYGFFSKIKKGSVVKITNKTDTISCLITDVSKPFSSVDNLLEELKWKDIYPEEESEKKVGELIKKLVKAEDIENHGLIAIALEHGESGGRVRSKQTKKKSKSRSRSKSKGRK